MPENLPIFILSSERSGTNLLRVILAAHSRIDSPPPSGLVMGLKSAVDVISREDTVPPVDAILKYAIALTQTHMNVWTPAPTVEALKARLPERPDFWEIFEALQDFYLSDKTADHWVSKEPGLIRYPDEILSVFPKAHIIYLVRDGRDVAISMTKKQLHARTVRTAIARWAEEQRVMLDCLARSQQDDRIHVLHYEKLTTAPEQTIGPIMAAMRLEFEPAQLEYYSREETIQHAGRSVFWKELAKPISSANFGKYAKALGKRDIELCEAEAGAELRELGYECHFTNPRPVRWHERLVEKLRGRSGDIPDMTEDERARRETFDALMHEIQDFAKANRA